MTSLLASAAGVPLAQQGSEIDRTQTEKVAQQRTRDSQLKADKAAGIGETDGENHETNDRDADGRRPWELQVGTAGGEAAVEAGPATRQSRDASGESGHQLDLTA
jgi:hypothetical protein